MMSDTQMMTADAPVTESIDESSSEASISQFLNQILISGPSRYCHRYPY